MARAAALTALGAGQAFGRGRQDGYGGGRGVGGDRVRRLGERDGQLRGARGVEAGEVDQRVCGVW